MSFPSPDLWPATDTLTYRAISVGGQVVTADGVQPAPEIPHTAYPLRYVNGRAVVVAQDSAAHMRDRIHVTCRTPLGDLLHAPEFGIPSQLLRAGRVDLDALAAAITQSEPDVPVTIGRVEDGAMGLPLPTARDESILIDSTDED